MKNVFMQKAAVFEVLLSTSSTTAANFRRELSGMKEVNCGFRILDCDIEEPDSSPNSTTKNPESEVSCF